MNARTGLGRTLRSELCRTTARLPWIGPRLVIRVHRFGLGAASVTWDELVELVEQERPKVLSVDVYDTCIMRDLLGDAPIELAIEREADGRNRPGGATADELEAMLCRPMPEVAAALDRIRSAGVSITFVSDTERRSETLRDLLADAGILVEGDDLRASCEEGATKSSGRLFLKLWPDSEARANEVWHVGNNLWSDVTMAQRAGMRAFAVGDGEPTRYETVMASRPETAGPAIAAAARRARLDSASSDDLGPDAVVLRELGADVAGQALGAFLLWVARQSREEGLGHLSFLSRDGELLLDMARAMPSDHWDGRSLGYIHCSRWSWLLAGAVSYGLEPWLESGTKDKRAFIHVNRHQVPLASLLGRIGLRAEDLTTHTELAGLDPREPLPTDKVAAWVKVLRDPEICDLIVARATVRHSLIIDYLRGLSLPRAPIGLVDVGWRGRLAWGMAPIIEEVTGHPPVFFHVGGDKLLLDVDADETLDIRRFAFDGRYPATPIANPVSCVETITASGRARVVGYERDGDGTVTPLFDRGLSAVANVDRRVLWDGAIETAARIPSRAVLDELGCSDDSLGTEARDLLALWWTQPERHEARAMRRLSFEADDDGQTIQPLVTPYSPRELSRDVQAARQWSEGSEAVSPPVVGALARIYRFVMAKLVVLRRR